MIEIDREELAERIKGTAPSNLMAHAAAELESLGSLDDQLQKMMNQSIMEMVLVFTSQHHSGFSGAYLRHQLNKLLDFQPLAPLTGEDDEWNDVGDGMLQNKRCSRVFRDADRFGGQAYDSQGKVFREANGSCYTNIQSHVPITFPYVPKTEFVDA